MTDKDAYEILGLSPEASTEQIRKNYTDLAKFFHPDASQKNTSYQFRQIQEAYELLTQTPSSVSSNIEDDLSQSPPRYPSDNFKIRGELFPCFHCGNTSPGIRLLHIDQTLSRIFYASRITQEGFYCPECARKTAFQRTLKTLLFGWIPLGNPFAFFSTITHNHSIQIDHEQSLDIIFQQTLAYHQGGEPLNASLSAIQGIVIAKAVQNPKMESFFLDVLTQNQTPDTPPSFTSADIQKSIGANQAELLFLFFLIVLLVVCLKR